MAWYRIISMIKKIAFIFRLIFFSVFIFLFFFRSGENTGLYCKLRNIYLFIYFTIVIDWLNNQYKHKHWSVCPIKFLSYKVYTSYNKKYNVTLIRTFFIHLSLINADYTKRLVSYIYLYIYILCTFFIV